MRSLISEWRQSYCVALNAWCLQMCIKIRLRNDKCELRFDPRQEGEVFLFHTVATGLPLNAYSITELVTERCKCWYQGRTELCLNSSACRYGQSVGKFNLPFHICIYTSWQVKWLSSKCKIHVGPQHHAGGKSESTCCRMWRQPGRQYRWCPHLPEYQCMS